MTPMLTIGTTAIRGYGAPMASFPDSRFVSAPPKIRLINSFADPYNNAIAAARTCYSSHLVLPEEVSKDERSRAQRDAIAKSTYAAGHHTVLQHATFQFTLENVSRQFVWSFLHSHPYYNSEQVSQRYVTVQPDQVLVPQLAKRPDMIYRQTVAEQHACYENLTTLLLPIVSNAYFTIFPARKKNQTDFASAVRKKAQELARYILPIGTFTFLYHSINGLTLHRYHRLCRMLDVPSETEMVVSQMVQAVDAFCPEFFRHIEDPTPLERTLEDQLLAAVPRMQPGASSRAMWRNSTATWVLTVPNSSTTKSTVK
jgi:flavin-dependent thymidylate synthase